jgi:hypothetical protein
MTEEQRAVQDQLQRNSAEVSGLNRSMTAFGAIEDYSAALHAAEKALLIQQASVSLLERMKEKHLTC